MGETIWHRGIYSPPRLGRESIVIEKSFVKAWLSKARITLALARWTPFRVFGSVIGDGSTATLRARRGSGGTVGTGPPLPSIKLNPNSTEEKTTATTASTAG